MAGKIGFQFGFNNLGGGRPTPREVGEPLRILVMGAFSGDAQTPGLHPVRVDLENFDSVFRRIAPKLNLCLLEKAGAGTELQFTTLEDFHPDNLYANLELFSELRSQRRVLQNPTTYDRYMEQLLQDTPIAEQRMDTANFESSQTDLAKALIRDSIAPHLVPDVNPQQEQMVQTVDQVISEQMRTILHQAKFQELEALWRGLDWLLRRVEIDESLQVFICDVNKQQLHEQLAMADDDFQLERTDLFKQLVAGEKGSRNNHPWSLLIGDYQFTASSDDVYLLASLGALGSQAGGPFVAAAVPQIFGCKNISDANDITRWEPLTADEETLWRALRESPMSGWLGLCLPGFLLRLPYGESTDEIGEFRFEEVSDTFELSEFLWANGAFAIAALLARRFAIMQWQLDASSGELVEGLPVYTYDDSGERRMLPCAQVFLNETALDAFDSRGLISLASKRNQNAAQIRWLRSISLDNSLLNGAWQS